MNGASSIAELVEIAQHTQVFTDEELVVLEEVLESSITYPEQDYTLLTAYDGDRIAGYVIFGRTPMTTHTWDMYWVVVASTSQRKGYARSLIAQAESYMSTKDYAIIRVETSSRQKYEPARLLYEKCGYDLVGIIHDFYRKNDSLITYTKKISVQTV